MVMVKIKNLRLAAQGSPRAITDVTEAGWAAIVKQGWASRFEVLGRHELVNPKQPTFIPPEVAAAASAAQAGAAAALVEGSASTDETNDASKAGN